jgi:hypothetical protein
MRFGIPDNSGRYCSIVLDVAMFLKTAREATDPRLRSLLQKATRRGFPDTTSRVAIRLTELRDTTWLRSRTVVITFEECWPAAKALQVDRDFKSKAEALGRVCRSQKNKDAAGLGALAFALHEGDVSAMEGTPDSRAVRIVAEGLNRQEAFFRWAFETCSSSDAVLVVEAARKYVGVATWGWDKACILAGAFLAATKGVPPLVDAEVSDAPFPYWVALDKHTPRGKEALKTLANVRQLGWRQLIWCSFYFESAVVNSLSESIWWEAECSWRLGKVRLTPADGFALWSRVRQFYQAEVTEDAERLRSDLESDIGLPYAD